MSILNALYSTPSRRLVLITVVTVIFYELALAFGTPPFAWIFAVFACSALSVVMFVKKTWTTYISMVLLSLFVICAVAEWFLYANTPTDSARREAGDYGKNRQTKEPVLGYGPKAQAGQGRSRMFHGDTLLYDVIYTTNEHGWRITPVHPEADTAVLFFGCSFTIGEGVNDAQSYPYRVGAELGTKYQTFNFGFHGYGAHQFLSLLESRRLQTIFERYKNVHVFFLNIAGHELRSGGYSTWAINGYGPRYVLENGKAVRKGIFAPFDMDKTPDSLSTLLQAEIYRTKRKSYIYRKIFMEAKTSDLENLRQLQSAIFVSAQDFLRQYPNTRFSLLVYPGAEGLIPAYNRAGLSVVDMRGFFPKDPSSPEYSIQGDGHPSALAQELIAKGIVDYLQHGKQTALPPNQ